MNRDETRTLRRATALIAFITGAITTPTAAWTGRPGLATIGALLLAGAWIALVLERRIGKQAKQLADRPQVPLGPGPYDPAQVPLAYEPITGPADHVPFAVRVDDPKARRDALLPVLDGLIDDARQRRTHQPGEWVPEQFRRDGEED